MITTDSIIINARLSKVYATARNIEKQHEFIPGYKPAEVFKSAEGHLIVNRIAEIGGKTMKWQSIVLFNENRSIEFEQIEGRLKGMTISWLFEEVPEGTRLTITHSLKLVIPVLGYFIERFAAKPAIDKLTTNVLKGLKNKMEGN